MSAPSTTLVCFAVKEEARPFRRLASAALDLEILLTGIGRQNARRATQARIQLQRPGLVLTCGFAGGLRPGLPSGTVLFATDADTGLADRLQAAGARAARFHCVDKVVTTAEEKRSLWELSGADAVEMESEAIRAVCGKARIASATVRVILDRAEEDLPLDFNQFMDQAQQVVPGKVAWAAVRSPAKIRALLRLQRQARFAAARLAEILSRTVL
jgi:adenosylhomocysteine nucleosidase